MPPSAMPRIAIIGAGMTGLACARELRRRGMTVEILEKSRGLGGRLATRRNRRGERFDHGAQFVTARDQGFAALLATLHQRGVAQTWSPRRPADAGSPSHAWWVGTGGMKQLVAPLAEGVEIRLQATVTALHRAEGRWRLVVDGGGLRGDFDAVVLAAPAAQAQVLLDTVASPLARALEAVAIAPCWALLLAFETPWALPFDVARMEAGPIAWTARQSSRPGLAGAADTWVVHASPAWSREHLELAPEAAAAALQDELAEAFAPAMPSPAFVQAHRWRYAMTTQALGRPFLADPSAGLWVGGDWCLGARVENAFQSGTAIAEAVATSLGRG